MNRILVASALVLGFAGAAVAQEDVFIQGNYSASVLNQAHVADSTAQTDSMPTASIGTAPSQQTSRDLPANTPAFPNISSGF